jgi:hypothetical protein
MADEGIQNPPQIDTPIAVPPGERPPQPVVQAAVDPDALRATMSEAFEQGLSRFVSQHPPAPPPAPQVIREQAPPPPGEPDPVTKVIAPSVGPALRHLQMEALDAKDAAVFYGRDPGDNRKDFSPAIEEVVQHRRQMGMPVTREDAYYWLQGRYGPQINQYRENMGEMARARYAATVGGGMGREVQPPVSKDPHDMTDQELNEALKGKIF